MKRARGTSLPEAPLRRTLPDGDYLISCIIRVWENAPASSRAA